MSWWHSYRSVSRDELTAGALALAEHGWPVLPGTFWQGRRWTGMPDAPQSGSVPVPADGLAAATCDTAAITDWWAELPYSVLLPTGSALDAIEVSPAAGRRLSVYLRESGIAAPAGTTSAGRWWFLVGAGEPLRPELASRPDVTLHGRGSWVVAPPSQDARGGVQWCVPPVLGSVSGGRARDVPPPTVNHIPVSRAPSDEVAANRSPVDRSPAAPSPASARPPGVRPASVGPAVARSATTGTATTGTATTGTATTGTATTGPANAGPAATGLDATGPATVGRARARPARTRPGPARSERGGTSLPDTYDVQLALMEVLGQRSVVAAAASAVGAARAHRWH